MYLRAPAIRPVPYRTFTVKQPDPEDAGQGISRLLPKVRIEAGRLMYDVLGGRATRRVRDWRHGAERVERHLLWRDADLSKASRKAALEHAEMAWDCRIPRLTPPGGSAGLVLAFDQDLWFPRKRGHGSAKALQVAFLPDGRGYVVHDKRALALALVRMVEGVGFSAEDPPGNDLEALESLTF